MVGRDHHQILRPQPRQQLWQPAVKPVERLGIALRVVAMTIEHIKIDQVDKAKPGKILLGQRQGFGHAVVVTLGLDRAADPPSGKNIINFAHPDGLHRESRQSVEHRVAGCGKRKVVPARRAGEMARLPLERTRDYPSDSQLAGSSSRAF